MSFVRPNAYTTGTAINGAAVRANHEALRDFLNRKVRAADVAAESVDWTNVLAGEYASVTKDHRFTTGWHYAVAYAATDGQQTTLGSSMKFAPDNGTAFPVVGKRVRATVENALCLVTAYLQVLPQKDTGVAGALGAADLAYLYIDGVQVAASEADFFAGTEAQTDTSDAGSPSALASRLRVATFHTLVTLDIGMHDIELRISPWHSTSVVRARSLNVEMFEV